MSWVNNKRKIEDTMRNDMILTFANLLVGNKIDTQSIIHSLRLLCDNFLFDCGLLYEKDFHSSVILKEHYNPCCLNLPNNILMEDISAEIYSQLKITPLIYVDSMQDSDDYLKLKNYFCSESVIILPLFDEESSICGLIVLMNAREKKRLSDCELENLSALLNMLSRYVSIRLYQKKLEFARKSLEGILDNTGIDIYVNDFYTHEILYVNKSMAAPYGGISAFEGKKCWEVLFPGKTGQCEFCPQKELIDENNNPTKIYSWNYQRYFDGAWFRVFSAAFRWVDGRLAHVVSSADITDNKRNEEIIKNMANYDPLTKLPNRRLLVVDCEKRINLAAGNEKGYVLFFDIDGFKAINDTLGHDAGDEFLVNLGEFFNSISILKDSIYRNGGDEFVAIINGSMDETELITLLDSIFERFKKPWILKTGSIVCNTSIGIACYPEDGVTAEDLLYKSDQAMYQVKKAGGGGICFGRDINH